MFSNKIVGYSIDKRMKARLAVNALNMAVAHRGNPVGVVVHSDRGSQTGLNRWKQHLIGGCCGKTIELDEGSDRASADAVTRRTIAPASEGA